MMFSIYSQKIVKLIIILNTFINIYSDSRSLIRENFNNSLSLTKISTTQKSKILFDASNKILINAIPQQIFNIINQINSLQFCDKKIYGFTNRLILYGPPGNGKTTLAKLIAEQTKSELIFAIGPTIINKYVGNGATEIKKIFDDAKNKVEENNKKVVIFIDEIDSIANNNQTDSVRTSECIAATQTLWTELDIIKNDPRYFFIGATNKFKDLHPVLLDRFSRNVLELTNPDEKTRRHIVEFYSNKCLKAFYNFDNEVVIDGIKQQLPLPIDKKFLEKIVKATNNKGIRSIEDIVCELYQFHCKKNPDGTYEFISWPKCLNEVINDFNKKNIYKELNDNTQKPLTRYEKIGLACLVPNAVIATIKIFEKIYKKGWIGEIKNFLVKN